jgi:hypothetical protein
MAVVWGGATTESYGPSHRWSEQAVWRSFVLALLTLIGATMLTF